MTAQPARRLVSVPTGAPPEPEPLWREVAGAVVRDRRLALGRTLRQVAERAGLSPQYLSEIERGRKEPSSEMLDSICGALGMRLADLLAASTEALGTGTVVRLGFSGSTSFGPASRPSGPVLLAG